MSDTASVAPATADVDPIDALQLDDSNEMESETTQLAEHFVLGGPPPTPDEPEPETPAKAPETAPSSSPALPDGYTRDALGRVHGPDGRVLKKADADKLTATVTPQPTTEPAKPEAFRYRSAGENKDVAEFEYDPATGRVTVPPEHVGLLRDAMNARDVLAEGRDINEQLRTRVGQLEQALTQRQQYATESEARANALVNHYSRILSEPDEAKAIEEFFKLRGEWPTRLAEAKAEFYRQQAEAAHTRPASSAQPQRAANEPPAPDVDPRAIAQSYAQESLENLKLDHAFRDLTSDDWKQLEARLQRTAPAFLRPATAEEATQYVGVREGQTVFDTDAHRAEVDEFVTTLRAARATAEQRAKVAAANARATQPSISAPPVPGTGAPPVKVRREFKSEQDVNAWLDSDEL